MPLIWEQTANLGDWYFSFSFLASLSVGRAVKLVWTDCEGLCWNLAGQGLGEKPHADSYSAGQFSASFGSFTQPCTQWLHKADYKLQRIPEGAKSDAGANEPREPLIPVTEWDKLGKAWTTQIQGSPGSSKPALGTGDHYPLHSAGTQRRQRHVPRLGTGFPSRPGAEPFHLASPLRSPRGCPRHEPEVPLLPRNYLYPSLLPEVPCCFYLAVLFFSSLPHPTRKGCSSSLPQINTVLRVCLETQHRKRTDPKWQVSSQLKFSNKHPILKPAFNSREKPAESAPSSPPNYSSHPIPTETSRNTNAW